MQKHTWFETINLYRNTIGFFSLPQSNPDITLAATIILPIEKQNILISIYEDYDPDTGAYQAMYSREFLRGTLARSYASNIRRPLDRKWSLSAYLDDFQDFPQFFKEKLVINQLIKLY